MNLLITGSNGQLGNEIKILAANYPTCHFIFTDVAELDITNAEAVTDFFKRQAIHAVINCAAYTAVDKAETDVELASLINATGPANLARAAKVVNAKMIQVSTDYVFNGTSNVPLKETDATDPIGCMVVPRPMASRPCCHRVAMPLSFAPHGSTHRLVTTL